MYQIDPITLLAKETNHLPESSFYLGLVDIFAKDIIKEIKNNPRRDYRIKTIEKLQKDLQDVIDIFKEDKGKYDENQKQFFLRRKKDVDQKIAELLDIHMKMLKKESIVI